MKQLNWKSNIRLSKREQRRMKNHKEYQTYESVEETVDDEKPEPVSHGFWSQLFTTLLLAWDMSFRRSK